MIGLLAVIMLGTGNGSSPALPVMPNTSVGCDPCNGVRTQAQMPNPPQMLCTSSSAGDGGLLGCSAPPVTGPSWTS